MSLASWTVLTLLTGTALLAFGWGCALVLQKHAAWENAVARVVLLLLLAMPLALVFGPRVAGPRWTGALWITQAIDPWEQVPQRPDLARVSPPRSGRDDADVHKSAARSSPHRRTSNLSLFNVLLGVWIAGSVASLGSLAVGMQKIRRLVRDSRPLPSEENQTSLAACALTVGVRCPALHVASRVSSPIQVGWLHPLILVPETRDSVSREVLLHELAHLLRKDVWWMTFGRVVGVFWWFHPLVWLLARRMERSAERVCDDLVVLLTADAPGYAAQLVSFLRNGDGEARSSGMGIAVTGFRSGLGRRVARLLEPGRQLQVEIGRSGVALLTAGAVSVLGVVLAVAPSRGENQPAVNGQVIGEIHVSANETGMDGKSKDILPASEAVAISGLRPGAKYDDYVAREASRRLLATGLFEYVRVFIKYVRGSSDPGPGAVVPVEVVYTPKFILANENGTAARPDGEVDTPKVVATVNKVPILSRRVDALVTAREKVVRKSYSGEELDKQLAKLRPAVLSELIDRELVLQEVARGAVTIPEQFIDDEVAAIVLQSFKGDYAAFITRLLSEGYTEETFRTEQRETIAVQAMRYAAATPVLTSGSAAGSHPLISWDERKRREEAWLKALRAQADIRISPAS